MLLLSFDELLKVDEVGRRLGGGCQAIAKHEDIHRAVIQICSNDGGWWLVVRQHYRQLERLLADTLGITPAAETQAVYAQAITDI
jgi:DNA-binding SARP family transcriptional activator